MYIYNHYRSLLLCIFFIIPLGLFSYQFLWTVQLQSRRSLGNISAITFALSDLRLIRRNRWRWQNLQSKYISINSSQLWIKSPNYDKPRIVYKCDHFCGGLGDRFRGIVTCFLLSLVTDRQFMIHMTHPLDIKDYLSPNIYNWTFVQRRKGMKYSSKTYHAIDKQPNFENFIRSESFTKTFSLYDNIEIRTNLDLVPDIFRNPHLRNNKIIKMFLQDVPLAKLNMHILFPLFFEILFQPNINIVKALEPILETIENGFTLTCIHLRTGQNPSNRFDAPFRDRVSAVEDILNFLDKTISNKEEHTRIFATADSDVALSKVVDHFGNKTITVPGPILHVDHPRGVSDVHGGFLKVIIEFYLLGECHTSILMASGFSTLANRRRLEPYHNLFKYNHSTRRIKICHDIYESAQSPRNIPLHLYCRVVLNNTYSEIW